MYSATLKVLQEKWALLLTSVLPVLFVFNPWTSFPYTFLYITSAIFVFVYWEEGNLLSIGLDLKADFLKTILIAFLYFLISIPLIDFIIQPLVNKLVGSVTDFSAFEFISDNFNLYVKYLSYTIISAAIGEEVLFRGFVFRQLNILMADSRYKTISIVTLSSALFSFPHWYQGLSGLIMTFIFGVFFAVVYVRSSYNLWVVIVLHGLIDTMFMTLAYCGRLDYYLLGNKFAFGF